jgi:hypothetical protein
MSRKFSWSYVSVEKRWHCKETKEIVSDIMIDNAIGGDFAEIPESFRMIMRDLMLKSQRSPRTKLEKQRFCKHENKVDVSVFGDSMLYYTCPECGWNTPRPRRLDELELTAIAVAEGEALVRSWKEREKKEAEMLKGVDNLIQEALTWQR